MALVTAYSFGEIIKELDNIISSIEPKKFKETRWFRKKADDLIGVELVDYGVLEYKPDERLVIPAVVSFHMQDRVNNTGYEELYYLPLVINKNYDEKCLLLLEIENTSYTAYVYEGIYSLEYNRVLDEFVKREGSLEMEKGGYLQAELLNYYNNVTRSYSLTEVSSNSLALIERSSIIKTYRKMVPGVNPDLEIGLSLIRETGFRNFPEIKGYVSYQKNNINYDICLIEQYVNNEGDVWAYTQRFLSRYLHYVSDNPGKDSLFTYLDPFIEEMEYLGEVIGELHLSLSGIEQDNFKPRKPTLAEIEAWHEEVQQNTELLFKLLKKNKNNINNDYNYYRVLNMVLDKEKTIFGAVKRIFGLKDSLGKYMRVHGDLHLEQILKTEDDFMVLDFEGEPLKSIQHRRMKYSPLKDIAGMMRSFNYAGYAGYFDFVKKNQGINDRGRFIKAISLWEEEARTSFLTGYQNKIRENNGDFLPPEDKFDQVLALFKIEKALYEGIYEINNRPDWLHIPLQGILDCVEEIAD
ncbi:hypothetical protein [Halothermothrix orenii]|uniref:Uncharacterized protein, probably involved in trehalose biosynthesis n=1 Tax=Halothermothrix orenii (strain H 168 / OCM 544 / DSM 9562) TaxID=373903 RepID=B8D0V2_HALOH|nr:hypothetical protein [Halothermothrix orenii]ACL68921.1 uncharacterized protein, probably involved in trehalose biosynthesis [Halothermothrix orenii H 168]